MIITPSSIAPTAARAATCPPIAKITKRNMIANLFKKSNDLNYFISGFLILIGAFSNQFEVISTEGSLSQTYASIIVFLIAFSVMIFMDVYLKQQNFFKKSSDYKMFYALLFIAIPSIKINLSTLLAPFLLFFSIYNMNLSFSSKTNFKSRSISSL